MNLINVNKILNTYHNYYLVIRATFLTCSKYNQIIN